MARYRADLIDTAWAVEKVYGTTADALSHGWGIVTAGITLPDPRYEWAPFYGVGVDDRNLLTYIQGRQVFEGAIGSVYLCQDASRLIIGDSIGQIFNATPVLSNIASCAVDATTITVTGGDDANVDVASGVTPSYIAVIKQDNIASPAANGYTDTFGYIGSAVDGTTDKFNIHHSMNTTDNIDVGWQGKVTTGSVRASVFSISRVEVNANNGTLGVLAPANKSLSTSVGIRETLKQNSFTLGSKISADNGKAFTSNFMGNKIGNIAFNFAENAPVSFNISFTGQDMTHDMQGGAVTDILKYNAPVGVPTMAKITEQPYFFSKADIKFGGVTFAKFRTLTLTINNQLDPRFYVTQSGTSDNRQILSEILEGRRAITITGSVDMDDTGSGATAGAQSGPDIKMLQYLFNQGFNSGDPRDFESLIGVSLEIELKRYSDASASANDYDTLTIKLPATDTLSATNPGLILNSARYGIPAPPQVHQNLEIDGIARSMRIEIKDSI